MGKPSDKNDKTQLLSESQVIEVKPSPPKRPVEDKNDRSMWAGRVVGADEFAPPPPAKAKSGRWIVLAILAVAGLGGAAYYLWPRDAVKLVPDATAAPVVAPPPDVLPQDAAPAPPLVAPADAAIDAAVPADAAALPADAGVARKPVKVPFKIPGKRKVRPPPGKRPIQRTH
ncbi:MAG: hypothetical protein ABI678_19865 [Kofleriaceae bacterium]